MAVTLNYSFGAEAEIRLAERYPFIRLFTVGFFDQRDPAENHPKRELGRAGALKIEQRWSVGSSASVYDRNDLTGGSDFGAFSAVAWYFGRQLADKLNKSVPIGLISSNIGGTAIQDWSPAAANANCNGGDPPPYPPWLPFPPKAGTPARACPKCMGNSTLYNGNIAPFSVGPMRLAGMLWYVSAIQGDTLCVVVPALAPKPD